MTSVLPRLLDPHRLAAWLAFFLFASFGHAAELRGRTIDSITGKSLTGASVTLTPTGPGTVLVKTADIFGQYEFTGVAAGSYTLGATHHGYIAFSEAKSFTVAEIAVRDIPLDPLVVSPGDERIDIFAQVFDTSTMRVLSGVPVRFQRFAGENSAAPAESAVLTTDTNGHAVLLNRPKGWYTFRFNDSADGTPRSQYAALDRFNRVFLEKHHAAVAQLLPTKRSVKVIVTGPDPARPEDGMVRLPDVYVELLGVSGDPPALPPGFDPVADDVRKHVLPMYPAMEGRTDANGEIVFNGLPPLIYVCTTKKPGYRTPQLAIVPGADEVLPATFPITLLPDLRAKVDVFLTSPYPAPGLLPDESLRLEGVPGTATAGIERMAEGGTLVAASPDFPRGAVKVVFPGVHHLIPGRYRVSVTDKPVKSALLPALEDGAVEVEVRFRGEVSFDLGQAEAATVELPMTPVPATIRGRLFRAADRPTVAVPSTGAAAPLDRWEGLSWQPVEQAGIQFVESVLADLLPPGVDLVSANAGPDGTFSLSVLPGIYGVKIPTSPDWGSNYRAENATTGESFANGWPYATAPATIPLHPFGSRGIPFSSGDDFDIELFIRRQIYYLNGNVIVDIDSQAQDRVVARDETASFFTPYSHLAATLEALWDENAGAAPPAVPVPLVQGESVDLMGTKTPSSGAGFVIPVGPGTHSITLRHKSGFARDHYTLPLGSGGTFTLPDYGTVGSGLTLPATTIPLENVWEHLPSLPDAFRPEYANAHTLDMRFYGKNSLGDPELRFTRTRPHFAWHPDLGSILFPIGQGAVPFKMMKGTWRVWRFETGNWYQADVTLDAADPEIEIVEFNLKEEYPLTPGPLGDPPEPEYDLKLRAVNEDDPTHEVPNIKVEFGEDPDSESGEHMLLWTGASESSARRNSWKGGFTPLKIESDSQENSSGITAWAPAFGDVTAPTAWESRVDLAGARPLATVTMRLRRGSSVDGRVLASAEPGNSEPLVEARVRLRNRFGQLLQTRMTDADGRFASVPALTTQQVLFAEVDAPGYQPVRFRVSPASTGVVAGTQIDFHIGDILLEPLPQPEFPGLTDLFNRKGMFLVGVRKGTPSGAPGTSFGNDPDILMTFTAEAAPPAPPAMPSLAGYDTPAGAAAPPVALELNDPVIAFWIAGQRSFAGTPGSSVETIGRPPYERFPEFIPEGEPGAGGPHPRGGELNSLFPVQMRTWLANLQKKPAAGAPRKEQFVLRHTAPVPQPGGLFRSTGTIDLASLPPGLFQPYVIAETRLGAYKVLQVKYEGAQENLNLFGMELPRWLNALADLSGTISYAQKSAGVSVDLNVPLGFVKIKPSMSGDIEVRAAGPYAGTLDYHYEIGANFSDGSAMPASGMMMMGCGLAGLEIAGVLKVDVNGSSPTTNAPGFPSIALTGEVALGVSTANLVDKDTYRPPASRTGKNFSPLSVDLNPKFGVSLRSTELGDLPGHSGELYRPLQRRMKLGLSGAVRTNVKFDLLRYAYRAPAISSLFVFLARETGALVVTADVGGACGAQIARERTTRYRVPGELLPPGSSGAGGGSVTPSMPLGTVEESPTAQITGIIGDEIFFRPGTTDRRILWGFSTGLDATVAGTLGAGVRLETKGPSDQILSNLPTLNFVLNEFGDFPPVKRVTGSVKGTATVFLDLRLTKLEKKWTWLDIPVDVPFNTEAVFYLVPFTVTESSSSLASAPPAGWCGAEPHLVADYSSLSPHAAASSGAAQTMAFIDPDSAGGTMRLKVAKQISQGAWTAPVTVASAPGILGVAVNAAPAGGWVAAWSETTTAGLTEFNPPTTIRYAFSLDGITWAPPATLGATSGTATHLKWLAMAGGTMGLLWQSGERGPGATIIDLQGAYFAGTGFGPIVTLYDDTDIASWDAAGPGFSEPTTAKILRLSTAGSLAVADWSGAVLGASSTLGTAGTGAGCRITAAPSGIFLAAATHSTGAFSLFKKSGPGAWAALTPGAALTTAAPREFALATATAPGASRFFLTWTEGADRRYPNFAWLDIFGGVSHGPTVILTDTPGHYSKLVAVPVSGSLAADIHAFFRNGDSGEIRAFATTVTGLPAADRDADGLSDLSELRVVDALSTDALTKIDDVTAAADYDGDGYGNGAELTAGTDPIEADSFPAQRVEITASVAEAFELNSAPAAVVISRAGNAAVPLTVHYTVSGSASNGTDCVLLSGNETIPAGSTAASLLIEPLIDALAEGSETLTLTLTADAAYTIGNAVMASVTIADRPFDAWRFTHFTASELANNSVGGVLGDAESDDADNLLEYAFDMDPKNGALAEMPVSGIVTHPGTNERHLALAYLRRKNDLELVYVVQSGSDLTGWTDATAADVEEISVMDNADGTETVTIRHRTPLSNSTDRRFLRLDVRRAG